MKLYDMMRQVRLIEDDVTGACKDLIKATLLFGMMLAAITIVLGIGVFETQDWFRWFATSGTGAMALILLVRAGVTIAFSRSFKRNMTWIRELMAQF